MGSRVGTGMTAILAAGAALVLGTSMLTGCSADTASTEQDPAAEAVVSDGGGEQSREHATAAPSDEGGADEASSDSDDHETRSTPGDDTAAAAEDAEDDTVTAQAPGDAGAAETVEDAGLGWCPVPSLDRVAYRTDDGMSCSEIDHLFASYVNAEIPFDSEAGVDFPENNATCSVLWGRGAPVSSQFNDLVMCNRAEYDENWTITGTRAILLPPGTAPLDSFGVPMEDFQHVDGMTGEGAWMYSFTVPGTDWVCSIRPAEGDGRGSIGCQGTFEEGWTAEAPDSPGQVPVNTVEMDENGPEAVTLGEALHMPYTGTAFLGADQVKTLEEGRALYVNGIGCESTAGSTLTCTAGEGASFTVTPTSHEFTPQQAP